MAQFLGPAVFQLSSASAVPYVGGKLHVYETGTSTPLSLFSDEDLLTPTANPLVADAAGVFPIAFLAETQCKIIITDSADQTLYTRDPVITIGFADNVPASGVSYDGGTSGLASNDVQDAIDEVVDLLGLTQDWETSGDGVIATGTSTNAGAGGGPDIDLYRNSASPANSDVLGGVRFSGKNASAVKTQYAKIQAVITDVTNGSEDGELQIVTKTAGGDSTAASFYNGRVVGTFESQSNVLYPLVSGTAQATTSGTSIDFTSIPSWVKRITIMLDVVSTNGTAVAIVQIGDSGGIENTGYTSAADIGASTTNLTTGFIIAMSVGSSATLSGAVTLSLMDASTNKWVSTGTIVQASSDLHASAGVKALSATLDRVRLTTEAGTATFDAGSVNILYE